MIDKVKLSGSVLLVVLGIWGYYLLSESPLILRILAVIGGILTGAAVAWWSQPGREFAVFAGESLDEVKRWYGRRARKRYRRPQRYSRSS